MEKGKGRRKRVKRDLKKERKKKRGVKRERKREEEKGRSIWTGSDKKDKSRKIRMMIKKIKSK